MVYDATDRVSVVKESFGVTLTYAYDAASNRTVVQDTFAGFITSTHDAANRLTSRQSNGGTDSAQVRIDLAYSPRDQVTTITRYKNLDGATKLGIMPVRQKLVKEFNRRIAVGATRFMFYHEDKDWVLEIAQHGVEELNRIFLHLNRLSLLKRKFVHLDPMQLLNYTGAAAVLVR